MAAVVAANLVAEYRAGSALCGGYALRSSQVGCYGPGGATSDGTALGYRCNRKYRYPAVPSGTWKAEAGLPALQPASTRVWPLAPPFVA